MKRIGIVPRSVLVDAALPDATATYTVISHGFIINTILQTLSAKGFVVTKERYTCNENAQVATGAYHINFGNDPDLGMLFAFSNSYNKLLRFRCAVGAFVKVNEMSVLGETGNAWVRKHTGTADDETLAIIEKQIDDAAVYFNQLAEDKEMMKQIKLTQRQYAELLGRLYVDTKIISGEQLGVIKKEFEKPSYAYTTEADSLWTLYNHILVALSKSHPRTWMEQQKVVHMHLMTEYELAIFDDDDTILPEIPTVELNTDTELNKAESVAVVESDIEYAQPVADIEDKPEAEEELTEMVENTEPETEVSQQEEKVEATIAKASEEETVEQLYGVNNNEESITMTTGTLDDETEEPNGEIQESMHVVDLDAEEDEEWSHMKPVEVPVAKAEAIAEKVSETIPEPIQAEAVREADVPAPRPTMTVEVAIEKYGHMLTAEEIDALKKLEPTVVAKMKQIITEELAKESAVTIPEAQTETVAEEESVTEIPQTELPSLPSSPNSTKPAGLVTEEANVVTSQIINEDKVFAIQNVNEAKVGATEDLVNSEPFFIAKNDIDEMYPGIDLEAGFIVTLSDIDFEIISITDTQYELSALNTDTNDAEVDEAENSELNQPTNEPAPEISLSERRAAIDAEIAIQNEANEANEDTSESNDDAFNVGDPIEMLSAKSMLRKPTAEEAKVDEVIAIIESKPSVTEEDKKIQKIIAAEIFDLYDEAIDFTYTLNNNQYKVTLVTGEVIILTEPYINNLMTNANE